MSEDPIKSALEAPRDAPAAPVPGGGDKGPADDLHLAKFPRTDVGNAKRFIARQGRDVLHTDGRGWFVWEGIRWTPDPAGHAARMRAHWTAASIRYEARALEEYLTGEYPNPSNEPDWDVKTNTWKPVESLRKYASSSENGAKLSNMLGEAAVYLTVDEDALDPHPDKLNVPEGTLRLGHEDETGWTPHPHDRDDLITRVTGSSFDPKAEAPTWQAFLDEVLAPDVQAFLARWFGYCLSGHTHEQKILLLYGTGGNGKSTMVETILDVMGDYAAEIPIENFLDTGRRKAGETTPDLIRLPGVRLVAASEPDSDAKLSEAFVKLITGGERITVRAMYKEAFTFRPQFKLVLSANAKPRIRGQDEGIWRRVLLVPFDKKIPDLKRDLKFRDKLRDEWPGILVWLISGWFDYMHRGLAPPEAVTRATEEYRSEGDPVGQFLKDWTMAMPSNRVRAAEVYSAYEEWCRLVGMVKPWTKTTFGKRLVELGVEKEKVGTVFYKHITLDTDAINAARATAPDPEEEDFQ